MITEALSATSSIGACWPPAPGTHERIRGFFTDGVVASEADVDTFAETYHDARAALGDELTRLSLRLVTHPEALQQLEDRGVHVEAAMPFSVPVVGQGRSDHIVAYTGVNLDERRGIIDAEHELDEHAAGRQLLWRTHIRERAQHVTDRLRTGLSLREISADTSLDEREACLDQFCELYDPFGYNQDDTWELLTNPDNHIVFIQTEEGTVVSTAMAEVARIGIGGLGTLVMAEITEASTRPELRGQGLYRLASGLLITRLADRSRQALSNGEAPFHVVYGECNMNMPGVLQAAMRNGRQFAAADVGSYGLAFGYMARREQGRLPFGVLEQNFRVEDGIVEPGRYNDFALSYVPATAMGALLTYPEDHHDYRFDVRTA